MSRTGQTPPIFSPSRNPRGSPHRPTPPGAYPRPADFTFPISEPSPGVIQVVLKTDKRARNPLQNGTNPTDFFPSQGTREGQPSPGVILVGSKTDKAGRKHVQNGTNTADFFPDPEWSIGLKGKANPTGESLVGAKPVAFLDDTGSAENRQRGKRRPSERDKSPRFFVPT